VIPTTDGAYDEMEDGEEISEMVTKERQGYWLPVLVLGFLLVVSADARTFYVDHSAGGRNIYDRPRIAECTALPSPQRLEKVAGRLSELTDPGTVYPEVCRALAQGAGTAAALLRVPPGDKPMPKTPRVAAYHFGSRGEDTMAPLRDRRCPSHQGFCVSHRLLERARADGQPLMTKSIFSCDTQVTISLIDEHSPRALMCAPLGSRKDVVDLLYVDVPIDDSMAHGPEEMFAFVQAVAQQATSVAARLVAADHTREPTP
jgi:hypothetical protein